MLEAWRPGSQSCIWQFNGLYWKALASGSRRPGGSTSRRCPAARATPATPRRRGRSSSSCSAVGRAGRAPRAARRAVRPRARRRQRQPGRSGWTSSALDAEEGRDYYRRLHYLMGDYSPHVLERARQTVAAHANARQPSCSTPPADRDAGLPARTRPSWSTSPTSTTTCRPTRSSASAATSTRSRCAPTSPARGGRRVGEHVGAEVAALPELIERLLRLGPGPAGDATPDLFATAGEAVAFWRQVWEGCAWRSVTSRSRGSTPTRSRPT